MQKTILTKVGELTGKLMETMANAFNVDQNKIAGAFKFDMNEDEMRRLFKSMSSTSVENADTNLLVLGYQDLEDTLVGPNAFVFSNEDAVSAPKVLAKFARKNENLVIKGGIVEGRVVNSDELKVVATLPNKEGLLSMLLGCLTSPVVKFACAVKEIAKAQEQE
jgi:large subunit ribosomal protein L10